MLDRRSAALVALITAAVTAAALDALRRARQASIYPPGE